MTLSCDEQAQVAQAAEAETAMPAREAAPAIVENVVVCFGAHFVCNELVGGSAGFWLASSKKIGARAAYGVFHDVRDEEREEHADQPPEYCDVCFMCSWAHDKRPCDEDA